MLLRWRSLLALAALAATGCATPTKAPAREPDYVDVVPPIASATVAPDRTPMHVVPALSASGGEVGDVAPEGGRPRHWLPLDNDTDGDGFPDDVDLCPTQHESGGGNTRDGCPQGPKNGLDRDGDGLLDAADRCPDAPEDPDGVDDVDGCPDIDNDKDGIPDASDKCPQAPETRNGKNDADGCPD